MRIAVVGATVMLACSAPYASRRTRLDRAVPKSAIAELKAVIPCEVRPFPVMTESHRQEFE